MRERLKNSEDVRRLRKAAKYFRVIFKDVSFIRDRFRFVQQLNLVNLITGTASLISSQVKIPNLCSPACEGIMFSQ